MRKQNKELLFSVTANDCRFDYFRGSGKGGQKKNVTDSAVRCTHLESKAVGKSEEGRSQRKNKELAFKRMAESKEFKSWHRIECSRKMGMHVEVDKLVDDSMKQITVDGKVDGKWTEI